MPPYHAHHAHWSQSPSTKLDQIWCRLQSQVRKTSTFGMVIIAIVLHSILSIILIHNYLNHYSHTYHSKHKTSHDHPDKGKISVLSKDPTNDDVDCEIKYKINKIDWNDPSLFGPKSINLLSSKLIKSRELSHIGWFSDHYRWEERVQCFNNRWTVCDKIYQAKCKPNSIRAIYQFVPFRLQSNVRHVFISVRATSEQLMEQSNNAFYGLLALVQHHDGTQHVIKMKFQYESETWCYRSEEYRSPKTISSITLMLACYGYTGMASFTDVRLSSESAGLDPLFSVHDICSWCSARPSNQPQPSPTNPPPQYEILNLGHQESIKPNPYQVTLVSQVSMDRLTILEQSLRTWNGPVSISIHIPVNNSTTIQDWQRLYINKKISSLSLCLEHSTIILVPSSHPDHYPINQLRNLALSMVKTRFMFLVDADFQPSPNLESQFVSTLSRHHRHYLHGQWPNQHRIAFVVPAFEYIEMPDKHDPVLKSKDELMQLIHRDDPMIEPFRMHESNEVHGLTNYWKWYHSTSPYNITHTFHDKYEPYVIVEKNAHLPLYDESLVNYGMNKVMHIAEMFAANYTFQVLPDVWVIHLQHRSTQYYLDFLKNLNLRLSNRAQRFKVLQRIIHQYNVTLNECLLFKSQFA